jgi:hypothetical protein
VAILATARYPLVLARAKRVLLSTTGATTVLSYTARKNTLLSIRPYVVVKNAATVLTLQASFTDPDFGADTYSWYNGVSVPVGVNIQEEIMVLAQGGTTVTITATAGTAGNVTVSASIREAE